MWRVVIGFGIGFPMGLFVEQALLPLHSPTCTVIQQTNERPPFLPQHVLHCPPGVEFDALWNEPEKVEP
jgi:hypothetical protein